MAEAAGVQEINQLREAGFSDEEITDWRSNTTKELYDAGFADKEIKGYFGEVDPDMSGFKSVVQANVDRKRAAKAKDVTPGTEVTTGEASQVQEPTPQPIEVQAEEADSFIEALEAGFDMSVTGLLAQGKPDMMLGENPGMFLRIASQVGTLAGDIPAMVAGSLGGSVAGATAGAVAFGAAGSVVPVAGTTVGLGVGAIAGGAVGAGAGAFALPTAIRETLMQHYEKGDIKSFSDFWERASAVFIETAKAGVIGGATVGAGAVVGSVAKGLGPVSKTSAEVMTEVGTMVAVGSALEGKVPEPHEFIDAAILVGGLRGAGLVAKKIRARYSKDGKMPHEIVEEVKTNPKLKQELLSDNNSGFSIGEFPIKVEPPKIFETVKALPKKKLIEVQKEAKGEAPAGAASAPASPVETILSKVGERKGPDGLKAPTFSEFYTNFVDKLDPINRATEILNKNKDNLPASENPYILSRTAVDAPAKAKHFFEKGVIDFNTLETKTPSLRSTLEKVESPDVLEAYMISKRVLEKDAQGFKTGFDVEAARKVVGENAAKYEAASKEITSFSNAVLDYAQQSGIISAKAAADMKKSNVNYVPFKRIIEDTGKVGSKKAGKSSSLRAFKGSEKDIQSPILSIVENTIDILKVAEINRANSKLIALAEKTPGQELFVKVKTPMKGIEVKAEEVIRALEEQGVIVTEKSIRKNLKEKGLNLSEEQIKKAVENEASVLSPEAVEAFTIFRGNRKNLTETQFEIFRNGKREVYETTPELAKAIKSFGGDSASSNIVFKVMNKITTFKKFGITFTPDFILRNFIRDNMTASTFTKSKGINPAEVVTAMGDLWSKNDTYYSWLKSGGANGAFLELNNSYIAKDIYRLQNQTNFMGSVRNVIMKPVDMMRVAAEISEQSLRLAEFKKRTKGSTDPAKLIEGGYASREITIDFQRVGAKISAWNSITAFMNVSIQGLDRTARAFKENPAELTAKSVAYITTPSILLWWAQKDDPRYQEIPRWQKDMFWIITTDNWQDAQDGEAEGLPDYMIRNEGGKVQVNKGNIYRVPKPQELGLLFGSFPERVMEKYFGENPDSFKEFSQSLGGLITPSFVPDAVAPAIEQYFNKSFFTGNDIVPHHLQGILPEYQFVEYTSDTAKTLGKLVATVDKQSDFASPLVLDNYIRSWGGSLGQYAVQTADKLLQKTGVAPDLVKPTSTLSDIPFVKAFAVRFPTSGSKSVQDFYDNYEASKQVTDTIRYLAKQGDLDNVEKEMTLNENQDKLFKLDGIQEALSNQSKFIKLVNKNPDMTPDEKRQMIDGTYLLMIETAKQGNELVQEIRKAVKAK